VASHKEWWLTPEQVAAGSAKKLGGNVLMGLTANGQLLLQENPQEWPHHHTLYQESRKDSAVIPY
jgi:hypothetical protein